MNKKTQKPESKKEMLPDLIKYPPSKGWVAVKNHLGTYDYENDRLLSGFFPKTTKKK